MSCAAASTLTAVVGDMCPGSFTAQPTTPSAVDLWVADASAPGGGFRFTVNPNVSSSAGGHTYAYDSGDTLFGTGLGGGVSAIIGTLDLSVDGQAKQIRFQFAGCPHDDGPPTSLVALVSATHGGLSQTVLRSYAVTPSGSSGHYRLGNVEPPDGCASGIDLMGLTF